MLCGAAHTLAVDVSFLHMCTNKWLPTASTLCPLSLPSKKAQAVSLSYTQSIASSPGSLAHSRGGRGAKGESLVHIVCACANYLGYHGCRRYPRKYTGVSIMGVYKILKYPKMCWRTCGYAERVAAHTTASDCLLGQSLVKLVAI